MDASQLALVFPGQGSQKVGMLAELGESYKLVKDTFAEASEALSYDMWDLIQNGDQQSLNLTETTQPVLLTASVAVWRLWCEQGGLRPSLLAGHSLGEFSALVCAGALEFSDAVRLVRARGQYMQTAVPVGEGAMAAVLGVDDAKIIQICAEAAIKGGVVEAVNFNSPGQVVIAGQVAAVDVAIEMLKAAGAKRAMPLPVSAPFHTSLMKPAGDKLAVALADIVVNAPSIPVVHNVHGKTESDPVVIKSLLVEQIFSAVKWVDCVETMVAAGISNTIECGPGKVLSGLNKRINKSLSCNNIDSPASLADALEATK
ncbi:Malonyl CoA-acyl carrier protein transacylase [Zhongshania aliphaticivorans]|uniref:Malonyl CoA-acyl carrier protein transacylase n=1 Tax=Zhongshania aliphaticivorans TaxID=1470434 RepID=A0A5S9NZ87_9GAMM|nr:ACP S-malonyltransferase [Zhongshania aliphaticivorans]CAA0089383.1 Malonyl CoA-acyl carrier protein transacylase [Zhongshania aliphaticivorans]CAA0096133.1 Malonyl CoA-acyl carrier protein transacylase [Zhongshania aliphaticivorans]